MTENMSSEGPVAAGGLTLLRLDDLPRLTEVAIGALRDLARPQAGLALLVLASTADASDPSDVPDRPDAAGLPVPLRHRSAVRANPVQLTPRELEILGLLTDGLTNRQIAGRLYLSERTVAHHVSAVLQKLRQPNRSAAAITAIRHGLVPQPAGPQRVVTAMHTR